MLQEFSESQQQQQQPRGGNEEDRASHYNLWSRKACSMQTCCFRVRVNPMAVGDEAGRARAGVLFITKCVTSIQ